MIDLRNPQPPSRVGKGAFRYLSPAGKNHCAVVGTGPSPLCNRQTEFEGGALALGAGCPDCAAMALNDMLGNRQSQAGSAGAGYRTGAGAVGLVEAFKDAAYVFRRNTDAGIVDTQRYKMIVVL